MRSGKSKPTYRTAMSILDTFGPTTAMHYLLLNQLGGDVLRDGLPDEFRELLRKIDESAEESPKEKQPETKPRGT